MVSVLVPGASGPGSSSGRGSWARHLNFTVPLSTQEYKRVTKTGISSGLMGYLARMQTFFWIVSVEQTEPSLYF